MGLTFEMKCYDLIRRRYLFIDLDSFAPNKSLSLLVEHQDGSSDQITLNHTYNEQQIEWFRAGSALNLIRANAN